MVRKANETRGVILFLDPDAPGEKIRRKLNDAIPGLKNAFVMKEDARTSRKVGIEHADKEVLAEALENLVTYGESNVSLSREEFFELGLSGEGSPAKREKIARTFHLGKCNAKTMFKRLNMLGVTYEQLKGIL